MPVMMQKLGALYFLGDACDDWGANEADELNVMEFYAKWVREHRGAAGYRIDVLLGTTIFATRAASVGPARIMSTAQSKRF